MKTKLILIVVLAATLGGAAGWLAPHQLASASAAATDRKILYYSCPMHPWVKSDKPGNCPECGMKLQPVYADASGTNAAPLAPSGCCSF